MFNKKIKLFIITIMTLLFVSGLSLAGAGITGAQFLKIGPGARPVAMGEAFSAVADDLNAIYWNPAGLAEQKQTQAIASYLKYFQEINIGFIAYSQQIFKSGTMGIGLNYLTIGNIEKRTSDTDTPENTFSASDTALYLSYADEKIPNKILEGLKIGLNLKIIYQKIDDKNAKSAAIDIGTLYKTPIKNLTSSLGFYNLGPKIKFIDEGDPLPIDIKIGFAYKMLNEKLILALDINDYVIDKRIYTQIGIEYKYRNIFCIRTGYKLGMDSDKLGSYTGLSAGVGFNAWDIQLDYAFAPYGELGDTHRISISSIF